MDLSGQQLVQRAVDGDSDALTTLLERHGLTVHDGLKISSKWRGLVEADDVMQVTYLEAFLRIREFEPQSPSAFVMWLRRIAENNLRDAIKELERGKRARNRAPEPTGDSSYVALLDRLVGSSTTPSRAAAASEIRELLEAAMRDLPPDYEKVLRLYELEGRPGAEVAAQMGRSPGAVKMLLARARDRLKELLGSGSGFFSDHA